MNFKDFIDTIESLLEYEMEESPRDNDIDDCLRFIQEKLPYSTRDKIEKQIQNLG